jgi:hypothetical protein
MSEESDLKVRHGESSAGVSHSVAAPYELYRPDVDISDVDERKLMRKIDLRLIPWLAGLYLLNSLDRGSIGNARVGCGSLTVFLLRSNTVRAMQLYGLETDINITDKQYLIALTVFFFPYSLLEVSNVYILYF